MSNQKQNHNETTGTEPNAERMSQVSIPSRVEIKIERRLTGTNFDSVDEYVAFVLESLLREIDEQDGEAILNSHGERDPEAEENEALRDRLESLGYL